MGKINEVLNKYQELNEDGAEKMLQALKKRSDKTYSKEEEQALLKKFRSNISKVQAKTEALVEYLEVKNIKDTAGAEKALKKEGIKWDKQKVNKDGSTVYLAKKEEVAIYDDQFNLLTIL